MPKISLEGTIGLILEVALGILDHLHVQEPFIVWGLFLLGLGLISDAIIRSDWVCNLETIGARNKRRALGMVPVLIAFALFGGWIYGRSRVEPKSIVAVMPITQAAVTPQTAPAPRGVLKPKPTKRQTPSLIGSPSPQPSTVNSAPNGIAIGGGVVNNPTVNNMPSGGRGAIYMGSSKGDNITGNIAVGGPAVTIGSSQDSVINRNISFANAEGGILTPPRFPDVRIADTSCCAFVGFLYKGDDNAMLVNSIKVVGDNADDFSVDKTNCPKGTKLTYLQTCAFYISFHPTVMGEKKAKIRVECNVVDKPDLVGKYEFPFSGLAVNPN